MTIGTVTRGTFGADGNYYYKDWSGVDYPKVKPQYTEVLRGYDSIRMWVYRGQQRIEIDHYYLLKRVRDHPPKRVVTVEHPYTYIIKDSCNRYYPYSYNDWSMHNASLTSITLISYEYNYSFLPSETDSNVMLGLLGKLREQVAGSSFNAGVFLGEGHQALKMITDSATRIYKGYKAARRGNFYGAAVALLHATPREHLLSKKVHANNWLELQYGWLPLLQDTHDAAQFLAHQLNYPLQTVVHVHARRKYESFSPIGSGWVQFGHIQGQLDLHIKAILKEKDVMALSGLLDPLSVAWELMPYSFVIDWFIPIGNYLSARGLKSALTGTFVTSTKRLVRQSEPKLMHNWGSDGDPWMVGLGNSTANYWTTVHGSRSISTNLAIPLPSFKPLGKVASWRHAANAVALLSQFLK